MANPCGLVGGKLCVFGFWFKLHDCDASSWLDFVLVHVVGFTTYVYFWVGCVWVAPFVRYLTQHLHPTEYSEQRLYLQAPSIPGFSGG